MALDEGALRDSIRNNLQRLLNSRQGGAPAAPSYGTPEFELLFRGGAAPDDELANELARCIMRYEPRLREVKVRFISATEEPMRLRFDISAMMVAGEDSVPTVFRSLVETSGRVKVGS